jgi:hypothetical protein
MWFLRIVWFAILCILGYSWFGGWGVVLVILASIHFDSPEIQYIEIEKEPLLKDQYDYEDSGEY